MLPAGFRGLLSSRTRRIIIDKGLVKTDRLAIYILVVHFALGVFYSLAVPIWEAYDEWGHYEFVRYVARERRLPPPGERLIQWNDETDQPPLYYLVAGLATSWIDTSDNLRPTPNNYRWTPIRGLNKALPPEQAGVFPYQGTVLAIHVARLVSVLLSTAAVWATYLIACITFPERRDIVLGATAVTAFWPQFLFNGSMVTNDIMVAFCASFFLLFLLRSLLRGSGGMDMIGMAICLGGAVISKATGIMLIPLACVGLAIAIARLVKRSRTSIPVLAGVFTLLAGTGLVAASWSRSGWGRHHKLLSGAVLLFQDPSSVTQLRWDVLSASLPYGFRTFWACFGWANIFVEERVYQFVALIWLSSGIGLLAFLWKTRNRMARYTVLILALDVFLVGLAPLFLALSTGRYFALQGRYVLPAISSVSLLLVLGLTSLVPERHRRALAAFLGVGMFAYAVVIPFRYIIPAYARPRTLLTASVQNLANPLSVHFGDGIALVGYELDTERFVPAGSAPQTLFPVTLYWCGLSEMENNYVLSVRIVRRDGRVYSTLTTHPGRGNFPTSLWGKGECFAETYWMRITAPKMTRALARVSVSFFIDNPNYARTDALREYLPVRDASGGPPGESALLGRIKIAGEAPRAIPSHSLSFRLGDNISLVGYDLPGASGWSGRDLELTLYWETHDRIAEDYTVFVHIVDASGELVAQGDSQPVQGDYPTDLWEAGEIITDPHPIRLPRDLPAGAYTVLVGLYSLDTMGRLPVLAATGERVQADAISLGEVELRSDAHWLGLPLILGHGR